MPQLPETAPLDLSAAARNFVQVMREVEPVAEAECRARAPHLDCDLRIVVDDRPGQAPNAFQTFDSAGRPVIALNLALIREARNRDELAFVLGHEAAHHIAGHIPRIRQSAMTGALILGTIAGVTGAGSGDIRTAQEIGATLGSRRFSQDFELEADAIGAVIAFRAGYDPVLGAGFFTRLPDPGNRFLGTHPPNAARIEVVREVAAGLRR
jgi:predicted Zn-dependent protease